MYTWNDGTYLAHHGIKGQKWGLRRFQNPDGSLTPEGEARYGKSVRKLQKKAVNKVYKESRKNGGSFVFKPYRTSTGSNYDRVNSEYENTVSNDKKYKELSKRAYDAEMKRLLYERDHAYDKKTGELDDDKYDAIWKSKEYLKLYNESEKATKAKEARVKEIANQYVDKIKDAKLDDMKITEYRDVAKKYIDGSFDDFFWDENLEFNVDSYYEPGLEKQKFR